MFDENHALLRESGVSAPDMEECIRIAKQAGALGGKGIGACGNGGAVIVLCEKLKQKQVERALAQNKFKAFDVVFSKRGAGVN